MEHVKNSSAAGNLKMSRPDGRCPRQDSRKKSLPTRLEQTLGVSMLTVTPRSGLLGTDSGAGMGMFRLR